MNVKQLNKITKRYYFYTLKALWDGQGKIKMHCGMSRVKKQLPGKRSINDLIVNIILDYLKKTVHNLYSYTITKNKQRVLLWKKSPETFKQKSMKIPKKKFIFSIPKKKFIFSKVAGFKNEFIYTYFPKFLLEV